MDADEVCDMIDTVSDGKPYTLPISNGVNFEFGPNGVSLIADGIGVLARISEDTRPAREIAVALVSWADGVDHSRHSRARNALEGGLGIYDSPKAKGE
jgi:hypothetical protein